LNPPARASAHTARLDQSDGYATRLSGFVGRVGRWACSSDVVIQEGGFALNGAGPGNGLVVLGGNVSISSLTIDTVAKGGAGSGSGGGGAELGGGLFAGTTSMVAAKHGVQRREQL
jgi:hypothetical protein